MPRFLNRAHRRSEVTCQPLAMAQVSPPEAATFLSLFLQGELPVCLFLPQVPLASRRSGPDIGRGRGGGGRGGGRGRRRAGGRRTGGRDDGRLTLGSPGQPWCSMAWPPPRASADRVGPWRTSSLCWQAKKGLNEIWRNRSPVALLGEHVSGAFPLSLKSALLTWARDRGLGFAPRGSFPRYDTPRLGGGGRNAPRPPSLYARSTVKDL